MESEIDFVNGSPEQIYERGGVQAGHQWIRTFRLDGQWCERCGLSAAQWVGEKCSGVGAAVVVEAKLASRIADLRAKLDAESRRAFDNAQIASAAMARLRELDLPTAAGGGL